MPRSWSSASVLGPMPGMTRMPRGSRKAWTSSGTTTVSPYGFLQSDAILDTSMLGATPSETVALLRAGADDDGLVAQGGVVTRLDRGVVGVHVHMRDDSHVATTLAEGARASQYAAGR